MIYSESRPPEGIRFCLVSTRSNLLLLSRMLIYCPELGNTCAKPHYKFSSGKIALSSLQSEVFLVRFLQFGDCTIAHIAEAELTFDRAEA